MSQAFQIPATSLRVEQEIKKSRFITSIEPVSSRLEAKLFIEQVRAEFPDANHNCWAFVIGDPDNAAEPGQSDDGEPQGTAGKPMLNVLQHKHIGNIAAVVTRYFGGIKLGTGGLVRAYSSSVQQAIEQLPLKTIEPTQQLLLQIPFSFESTIRNLLSQLNLTILNTAYSDSVTLELNIPDSRILEIKKRLTNSTNGHILFYS